MTVEGVAARFGLEPMPVEGGLFCQTWAGPVVNGRPVGTAILVLLSPDPRHFSALHRLPIDEVWHFHAGDPIELLLLHPGGRSQVIRFGGDVDAGDTPQVVVPAGTWMGARLVHGGAWGLFGTTMAPGFMPADYEGGEADELAAAWPTHDALIRALCRAGAARRHAPGAFGG
ncbi:MAG: cupin domain-containing protein [Candidatus Limnocylindrales bacterium]